MFDGIDLGQAGALVPRATVEELVGYRNRAIELYRDAFAAIEQADTAIKAAHAMGKRAAPHSTGSFGYDQAPEVAAFHHAVKLPNPDQYMRVATRLLDIDVWASLIQHTDLESLMDHEAKEKLRKQMRYVPERADRDGQLITGEEIERGLPPVTVENIYATLQQFALDSGSIFRRGIANVFSKLDRRFRSHDGFKIGGRVILTYAFSSYSGSLQYGRMRDQLIDIERAFRVIDGDGLPSDRNFTRSVAALDQDRQHYGAHQSETETEYFKIRGYKNGNAHLWFRRDDLVEKVNKLLAEWYGEVIGDGQTKDPDIFDPEKAAGRTPARRFGFFPTPPEAARRVIEAASLHRDSGAPALTILEPSAGTGNLARLCATASQAAHEDWARGGGARVRVPQRPFNHLVDCIEIQPALADGLRAEGIYRHVTRADFLQVKPDPMRLYDRVVMNPPFDLSRDQDHVIAALKFLKPDGVLVSIMSAGTEFRSDKKTTAFRKLMRDMGGRFDDLPEGSFAEVGTNVNTILVRVAKDGRGGHWSGRRFEP